MTCRQRVNRAQEAWLPWRTHRIQRQVPLLRSRLQLRKAALELGSSQRELRPGRVGVATAVTKD